MKKATHLCCIFLSVVAIASATWEYDGSTPVYASPYTGSFIPADSGSSTGYLVGFARGSNPSMKRFNLDSFKMDQEYPLNTPSGYSAKYSSRNAFTLADGKNYLLVVSTASQKSSDVSVVQVSRRPYSIAYTATLPVTNDTAEVQFRAASLDDSTNSTRSGVLILGLRAKGYAGFNTYAVQFTLSTTGFSFSPLTHIPGYPTFTANHGHLYDANTHYFTMNVANGSYTDGAMLKVKTDGTNAPTVETMYSYYPSQSYKISTIVPTKDPGHVLVALRDSSKYSWGLFGYDISTDQWDVQPVSLFSAVSYWYSAVVAPVPGDAGQGVDFGSVWMNGYADSGQARWVANSDPTTLNTASSGQDASYFLWAGWNAATKCAYGFANSHRPTLSQYALGKFCM